MSHDTIPFFDPGIRILPLSAKQPNLIGTPITLAEFSNQDPVTVSQHQDGTFLAIRKTWDGTATDDFIEGPEMTP